MNPKGPKGPTKARLLAVSFEICCPACGRLCPNEAESTVVRKVYVFTQDQIPTDVNCVTCQREYKVTRLIYNRDLSWK